MDKKENEAFEDWMAFGQHRGWVGDLRDAIKDGIDVDPLEAFALENDIQTIQIPYVRVYGPRYFDKEGV